LLWKRIIVLILIAFIVFFWVSSIFSEKNAPGRVKKYVYSGSIANESKKEGNKPLPQPKPGKGSDPSKKGPGIVKGKVLEMKVIPPPDKTGKGPQPSPPLDKTGKGPQPSPSPGDGKILSALIFRGKEMPTTPPVPSPVPKGSPIPPPAPKRSPAPKEIGTPVPPPSFFPSPIQPDKSPVAEKKPGKPDAREKLEKKAVKISIRESDLKTYFDQRLNIQIDCPGQWKVTQSTTKPEFVCVSPKDSNLKITCRRARIMKDRKFDEEVTAIMSNEITGRTLENKKIKKRKIGKFEMARLTFDEYKTDTNNKKTIKNKLIYIFIESGDEISMFFFETPDKYKEVTFPIIEKMIKSIKVIKRPKPAGS